MAAMQISGDNRCMKFAVALIILALPATLAAKRSCMMEVEARQQVGTTYSFTVGLNIRPCSPNESCRIAG